MFAITKRLCLLGEEIMFYRIFNDEVKLLKNGNLERYEKKGEKQRYGNFKLSNNYEIDISYDEIQCKLLPKPYRNKSNNVYMVSTEKGIIILQSYDNLPKVITLKNDKPAPKLFSELSIGDILLHSENKAEKVTSIDFLNNFNGKTYLKNYVFKIPINSGLIVNGFFIYN